MPNGRPLSDFTEDERAERDAVERGEDGELVNHVYSHRVAAFHKARQRVDPNYQPESPEARERREETTAAATSPEARERSEEAAHNAERDAREG